MSRAVEVHGLTERQAQVVDQYVSEGSLHAACMAVDYDYRNAKRLLADNPGFQAAVMEAAQAYFVQDAIKARTVLRELMEESSDPRVRKDAAVKILERGMGKPEERHLHMHQHQHKVDRSQLLERIGSIAAQLGISAQDLLQQRGLPEGEVIEAEAIEEEPAKPTLPKFRRRKK